MSTELDPTWSGLIDDAAIFPPGDLPLAEAAAAHLARTPEEGAGLVASFVLRDTDLPQVRGLDVPLSVVVTGGAGQVEGPAAFCARAGLRLAALEIALRDLDDLPGNARRVTTAVDAARASGALAEDVAVYVELPAASPEHGWLAAADEVAAAELRLKLRTGGLDAGAFPSVPTLARWIDAALDRETAFKCTAGLHHAVRHTDLDDGLEHHGFLNVLLATRAAFDGAGTEAVHDLLGQTDGPALAGLVRDAGADLVRTRRWFGSFGSCDVAQPLADLRELGLVA